ncbi:MAG: hypothetical protein K6B28_00330 [Lachnospiraceae bacterium]|nr:hypothetical protein [Lachnospiraceae bacterium]
MKDLILEIIHLNNENTYGNMYMGIYFIGLLFLFAYGRDKKYREAIVFPAFCLLSLLYFFIPFFNKYIRYLFWSDLLLRFLWILLIAPVSALFLTVFVKNTEKKRDRVIAVILIVPIIFLSGQFKINSVEFKKAENPYKLPQALLDISDDMLSSFDEPKVIVPYETAHVFRQYSTDILLLYGEDATFERICGTTEEIKKACEEMTLEIPDLNYIRDIGMENGVNYIIFDATYHCFGRESLNIHDYPSDPDYVGDRTVLPEDDKIGDIEVIDRDKDSVHWDLTGYGLDYAGTYGQYLLYEFDA